MAAPLAGIRVLEVANWLAGPSAGAILADLGADVVKVEPPGGDVYRHLLMLSAGYEFEFAACYGFELDNRGKRSVTLDLEAPGGPDVLRRLAVDADIVITNLTAGRCQRYGFRYEDVHAVNPRAIYSTVTGYGARGDDASRPGFDITAFWARSGIMSLLGEPDAPPTLCRGGMGDHTTGLNLLAALLVALRVRDQTGEGQQVEVTLQNTGMWTLALDVASALVSQEQPVRKQRTEPANPITNTYLCRDGKWIFLMMPTADWWPRFCRLIGRDDWVSDPRLQTPQGRKEHTRELTAQIEPVMASRDLAEWGHILDEQRMIWAPVATLTDVTSDPQARAMGWYTTIEHPKLGRFETLDTPFKVYGADIGARGPAPAPGEQTFEVLAAAGLSADEIGDLAASGVFG
ncbi:MAG: CoA transferase [Chloroflexi bacterium]|nr:CoA transferase [Chloroflexota bacterium]